MPTARITISERSLAKTIFAAGFIAGALDILGAILVYAIVQQKTTATKILQSVASGVFGKEAYSGVTSMALYGLLFHFIIAFAFATGYIVLYAYLPFLRKHKITAGLIYGLFAWLLMNFIVLPIAFTKRAPMTVESALVGLLLVMLLVGLPISLITHKYYATRKTNRS